MSHHGWANDAYYLRIELDTAIAKIASLKHKVKALQMLCKAQHTPIDRAEWERFEAEVDAIDAALKDAL